MKQTLTAIRKNVGPTLAVWLAAAGSMMAVVACHAPAADTAPKTDDQLLYEQARQELPEQDRLEIQVEEYRQELYIQNYLNLMLQAKAEAVSDDDCRSFFDQYGNDLKLEEPIVKGLVVKLPKSGRTNKELHGWLTQLSQGKDDCMPNLEQFCAQKAAVYDNFMSQWVRLSRLTDQLPITVVDARQFLAIKAYELNDQDYEFQFVVTDYRLAGEKQPYEWARQGILELLIQQKRETFRNELVKGLREGRDS